MGSTTLSKMLIVTCLLIGIKLACVEGKEESNVHVLTDSTFDDFIKKNEHTLVKFYAPWCGHCKSLAPHYEEAATRLSKEVPLAKLDATVDTATAEKYEIRGYPTLKFFMSGVPVEYTGQRTADGIVSWVQNIMGPAINIIDATTLEEKLKENKFLMYAKIASKESAEYGTFEKIAESYKIKTTTYVVISSDAENDVFINHRGEALLVKKISDGEDEIKKWIEESWLPMFGPVDAENFQTYQAKGKELVWFAGTEKDFEQNRKEIANAAKLLIEHFLFIWIDSTKFEGLVKDGLDISSVPGMIVKPKEGGSFKYTGGYVSADILKYFSDIKDGKVEKTYKSEPIPGTNDQAIKVVVGQSFMGMVFQKDKDVLLEVYAPWCGQCKKFAPVYEEIAERLSGNEHLIVAKIDGTANEIASADFKYSGFPTMFFVKAGSKSPVTYSENDRNFDTVVSFLKKHSSKPIEVKEAKEEAKEESKEDKDEL